MSAIRHQKKQPHEQKILVAILVTAVKRGRQFLLFQAAYFFYQPPDVHVAVLRAEIRAAGVVGDLRKQGFIQLRHDNFAFFVSVKECHPLFQIIQSVFYTIN